MTIDHVGLLFFPGADTWRIVGRLAFPLYAYLLVLGIESTHNARNYMMRLLVFAFISQLPFTLVNGVAWWESVNIYGTLFLGLTMVYLIGKGSVLFVFPLGLSAVIPVDYGVYGTAAVLSFYLLRKDWKMGSIIFTLLNIVVFLSGIELQAWAIFALIPILLHSLGKIRWESDKPRSHPTFRRYFFYAYYPVHLAALFLLKTLL